MQDQPEPLQPARPTLRFALYLLVAMVVLVIAWQARPRFRAARQGVNHAAVGKRPETLDLQALTGTTEDLTAADLAGQVTLINFWGTWCGPCRIEFPHLVEVEKKFRGREDFRFVSVSTTGHAGDEKEAKLGTQQFLREMRADFPTYRDANAVLRGHLMAITGLGDENNFYFPTTVVLGRDGAIRGMWQGYTPGDELEVQEVVQAALNAKP